MNSDCLKRFVGHFIVAAVCFLLPSISAGADSAKIELHTFQTITLTDKQFLTGARDGKSVVLSGELRLPSTRNDRVPAVVIVHGSGGIMGNEDHWAREFNNMGIAAFLLDSFTGRGIRTTGFDQSQLGLLAMVYDAFRALDLLAKDRRIDRARIGIIGGSRGARVVMGTSMKRFQQIYGATEAEFAVYMAFYTPCNTRYIGDLDVAEKPIRLFHGQADDYTPVGPCRSYVNQLRNNGKDVELKEYPGAYHIFDNPVVPIQHVDSAQTGKRCSLEERAGEIINTQTGRPFTWDDPCVERGVTVGYDPRAHGEAVKDVKSLLVRIFKIQ
jgi:dienelactone hydrolase